VYNIIKKHNLTSTFSDVKIYLNLSKTCIYLEKPVELKIRKSSNIYIIDIQGEMDLYNSYKLKDLVMKMLEKKVTKFIINLDKVEYIDSSGIGALIYICSTIKKMNLQLLVTNVHGSVKKVIELTKLMGYFPMAATVNDAIKNL